MNASTRCWTIRSIGMIGAKEWRSSDMGKNFEQYERLLDLLEVTGANRELDYLSGFMFLIRGDIVKRLHSVAEKLKIGNTAATRMSISIWMDRSRMASNARFPRWCARWAIESFIGNSPCRSPLFCMRPRGPALRASGA